MHQPNNHPYRQVHFDFHTSPDIPGIGLRFSKENFQEALKRGNVDSITVSATIRLKSARCIRSFPLT